ncbi:MAG: acetyl-CoA hydrolase/transferase C-terminal domain-containing protein, partial [Candidatus Binataceae bacterium]
RARIGHAQIFLGGVRTAKTLQPEHADVFTFTSFGAMGNLRHLAAAGLLHVIPAHLSQIHSYFERGLLRADVVLVQLSAPTGDGSYSYGLSNDFQVAAMTHARIVIAEVNDEMPWTWCEPAVDLDRIDYLVHTSVRPPQAKDQPFGPVEETIARHVSRYIEDGTTIQIGVGAIPDAVLASVDDRRDLGFHSGLISDRVATLMQRGVITNARKPIDTGITATGALLGTDLLYNFAHRNRAIRVFPWRHTHRAEILGRLDRFFAMNSAVEVDLTGQVNAEVAAGSYIGGLGGQGDFIRGAQLAEHGRSVIALPAAARGGAISRIVARLEGGIVTTARSDADLIATEYGVADLRGQPLAERVRRMIAISHPSFREELERAGHAIIHGRHLP